MSRWAPERPANDIATRDDTTTQPREPLSGPPESPESRARSGRAPSRGSDQRRQRQVAALLEHAWEVVTRVGIAGLTMEELAKEAGYTRSAVYRYFRSKEDIAIALAIEAAEQRVWLYDKVMRLEARPRERLVAFVETMTRLFPRHLLVARTAFANALYSERKQDVLHDLSRRDYLACLSITRQGVERDDLPLPAGVPIEDLALAVYGFTRGMYASVNDATLLREAGVVDLEQSNRRILRTFLDGLGWRPLSTEHDYDETMRRLQAELLTPPLLASLASWRRAGGEGREETAE
jgi:AcrR family transcriptional regulator